MRYMGMGVYVWSLGDTFSPPLPIGPVCECGVLPRRIPSTLNTPTLHSECLGLATDEGRDKLR